MLDRMGALGIISVFDVEEVGVAVLTQELGMEEGLADLVVGMCSERAKVVAEQQARDKVDAESRASADRVATDGILGSSGGSAAPIVRPDAADEARVDSILGGS